MSAVSHGGKAVFARAPLKSRSSSRSARLSFNPTSKPLCKLDAQKLCVAGSPHQTTQIREEMSGAALRWLMMMILPSGLSAVAGDTH